MVTFESDSKCVVVEKCEMMDYKSFTTTREIKGDLMLTVSIFILSSNRYHIKLRMGTGNLPKRQLTA